MGEDDIPQLFLKFFLLAQVLKELSRREYRDQCQLP